MRLGRVKRHLAAWCAPEIYLQAAEKIAEAIRHAAPLPQCHCTPPGCPECSRWEQAQKDADLAVELGGFGGAR